jgi:hypothetical protein
MGICVATLSLRQRSCVIARNSIAHPMAPNSLITANPALGQPFPLPARRRLMMLVVMFRRGSLSPPFTSQ